MLSLKSLAALACAVLLAACASRGVPSQGQVDVLPQGDPVAQAAGRPAYRIGPSDLLEIKVFQVEDLDREVRVDNAGEISLPLIGTVVASGKTIPELQTEIANRYRERYLQHPQVSVLLTESGSQRVTVSGEVEKPGVYPIESELTLVQALATAEGLSEVGDMHNVLVFRTVDGERLFSRYDIEAIQEGAMTDPVLTGNDVVVVPSSTGRSAWLNFIKLSPLFAVWLRYQ